MFAFVKKVWWVIVLVILGLGIVTYESCRPRPTPIPVKQSVIEQAAQHAAAAIVTVEHAHAALAQHVVAKAKVAAVRADTAVPLTTRVLRADSVLTEDNARLATELEKATGVVAADTVVRIPQDSTPVAPVRIKLPSFGAKVGKALLSVVSPTIGYGAVYDGHVVVVGPSAAIGLHITSGIVGVTAGASAVYAGHAVHLGAGVNVGVRL